MVMLVSVYFGFTRVTIVVFHLLAVQEYCKKCPEMLPSALGINMVFNGVFVLAVGQLLGWIRDRTESYVDVLGAQIAVISIIVVLWMPEVIYDRIVRDR